MRKAILVTGGLGYLGGRIGGDLARSGRFEVFLGTRRSRGVPDLDFPARVVTVGADQAAALAGVEAVIHLAAMNEIDSAADPQAALEANAADTLNLLLAAIRAGVRRFIYFSTAHVYGRLEGTIDEGTLPRPVHPYAISHHCAEEFVLAAHDREQIEGVALRLSNAFGYPAWPEVHRWTLVVNDLCRQAVEKRSLVLKSDGQQRRDFIAISDVARAISHLLDAPAEALSDGLFNLGGGSATIFEMAQRVAARCESVLGFRPQIHRPAPGPAAPALSYSSAKLRATGFENLSGGDEEIEGTLRACARWFAK